MGQWSFFAPTKKERERLQQQIAESQEAIERSFPARIFDAKLMRLVTSEKTTEIEGSFIYAKFDVAVSWSFTHGVNSSVPSTRIR
jgi:hypothetical protein